MKPTLIRQADLGQLGGNGIIHGLDVDTDNRGFMLVVQDGLGVARSGELIAIREPVTVRVSRLPITPRRDTASMSLTRAMPRQRITGLFVLVARPVESTILLPSHQ